MNKPLLILFLASMHSINLFAQQPPAQLPSLLEDNYTRTPILHNNENAEEVIRKSIFVKAYASEQTVYTGQPVLVTYKLYTCIFCKSRVSRQPSFNGCSITELGYPIDPEIENINGKSFHVFTIRKVQVIPLEEGPLHLGEVEVENLVPFVHDDSSEDNFTLKTTNDPLILQVKSLPEKNKPANFSNIVGSFTLSAAIDTNNVPVGDNATLNITIKGNGNFTGIHLPEILWPHSIEHFDASDTQHIDDNEYPVIGYKTFSVPFIGSKIGKAEIGPVSFNYFDPADAVYKTITVDKLPINFTKATNNKEQLQTIVQDGVTNRKYLWIVAAIATTVVITLLVSAQLKKKKITPTKIEEAPTPKQEIIQEQNNGVEILSALNRLGYVDDDKKFLSAAGYLLIASLQIKLSAAENATAEELVELLKKQDNADLSKMCRQIFADCNRNLYTPDAEEGIKEKVYFELSAVIKKLYPIT
jgi:hypothetical protein